LRFREGGAAAGRGKDHRADPGLEERSLRNEHEGRFRAVRADGGTDLIRGGNGCPADNSRPRPEHDPGGGPGIPGNPRPAEEWIEHPGPIVVGNVAPGVVRDPGVAEFRLHPVAVAIRAAAGALREWLPHAALATRSRPA